MPGAGSASMGVASVCSRTAENSFPDRLRSGMTEKPPDNPADHAEDFSHRWADKLDQYTAERMVQLGIPPEQIGSSDHERGVTWRAFFPDERDGGGVATGGRLSVDSGVFNPDQLDRDYGEYASGRRRKS